MNSNLRRPLRDGPNFTIIGSKTGKIPLMSTRKREQVGFLSKIGILLYLQEIFASHFIKNK